MLSEKTKNEESVLVYRAEIYIRMLVGLLLASLSAVPSTPYTQQVYTVRRIFCFRKANCSLEDDDLLSCEEHRYA
jgi:hypothetical protein